MGCMLAPCHGMGERSRAPHGAPCLFGQRQWQCNTRLESTRVSLVVQGWATPGALRAQHKPFAECSLLDEAEAAAPAPHRSAKLLATSTAAYVTTPSAPARLKPKSTSSMHASASSQPLSPAAFTMAYSPDTW